MVILTAQQMKTAEKAASEQGLSYLQMMDNAGSRAANVIIKEFAKEAEGKTLVLCGNGNNGGDGFVVARRLAQKGFSVGVVLLCGAPATDSAKEMANRLSSFGIVPVDGRTQWSYAKQLIDESTLVVDGVFGTGFHGQLPGEIREVFSYINRKEKTVVALDLPSGISADTGEVAEDTLKCVATVSFHAYKFAHVLYPGRENCGKVSVWDIGIPNSCEPLPFVVDASYVAPFLGRPEDNTHKGSFGTATMFVGSVGMAGAATFAVSACLRCGVGLVKPVVSETVYPLVASKAPEGVYQVYSAQASAGRVAELCKQGNACLMGCGSGKNAFTRDVVLEVISSFNGSLVLDADGINSVVSHIDRIKERTAETVLTPHPGEMARLIGKSVEYVQQNRIEVACSFAKEYGVVVVLKGAGTVIAHPSGQFAVSLAGNSGLSKGGSGDVLAGMLSSFLAQGLPAFESACVAVWLHGRAGEMASFNFSKRAMLPTDLINTLPSLFLKMETE